jgi:anti-sigma factor RsiW
MRSENKVTTFDPSECDRVSHLLHDIVENDHEAAPSVLAHVEKCLRCQAEVVQYRKLLRALHQLRTDVLEPAPGLLSDVLASLEHVGERSAIRSILTGRRAAYVGGLAVAGVAAGAAGAVVLAGRARRGRMRLAG